MFKTIIAVGVLALAAAPAAAQMAAGGAMPKCSATVRDSCDQSMTTERYAMSADAAMKTGGVGDRASDNAGKAMGGTMATMHHRKSHMHMKRHGMMHVPGKGSMTDTAPDAAMKPM